MKKIHSLRRQAVILLSIGLGIMLGKIGTNIVILAFLVLFVLWLLAYDFAVENRFGRQQESQTKNSLATYINRGTNK